MRNNIMKESASVSILRPAGPKENSKWLIVGKMIKNS